jgi:hypothetical protein
MAARRQPRWRRRWRRRFSAMAILVAVGRLQDRVILWIPAAWLNIRRAFKPLARQRSYSAEKSALETAGCGVGPAGAGCVVGQAGSPAPAPSPLTMLAHVAVGETREVGGRVTAGTQPARQARLPPQRRGRRGRRGRLTAIQLICCTPRPRRGGRQSAGVELLTRQGLAANLTRVGSELDKGWQRTCKGWQRTSQGLAANLTRVGSELDKGWQRT